MSVAERMYGKKIGITTGIAMFLCAATSVAAWSGPTASAPSGNLPAPINVGTTNQVKNANLGVNGLAVFGNSLLQASSYLNWGSTAGASGYGIRDNAGTLEFKNSGGSWASLQSTVQTLVGTGGGGWATSGNNINNTNTGWVVISTANGEGGTIQLKGNNGTNVFLESINGTFRLVNSPWTAQLFSVDQSGNAAATGNVYIGAIGMWASDLRLSQQLGATFTISTGGCGGGSTLRCDSSGAIQVGSSQSSVQCSSGCSPWNSGGCQPSYYNMPVYYAYCRAILH